MRLLHNLRLDSVPFFLVNLIFLVAILFFVFIQFLPSIAEKGYFPLLTGKVENKNFIVSHETELSEEFYFCRKKTR